MLYKRKLYDTYVSFLDYRDRIYVKCLDKSSPLERSVTDTSKNKSIVKCKTVISLSR